MSYSKKHLREAAEIISQLDPALCETAVQLLAAVRERGGRLFVLGVGGSAANASRARLYWQLQPHPADISGRLKV